MRTKLEVREVRVPTKRVRAEAIQGKFADLDDLLDGMQVNAYAAAGAIAPEDGLAFLDATEAGMAMTLADGSVVGETMHVILRSIAEDGVDTAVITPANLTGGSTLTFDEVNQRETLIWVGAAWTPRPNGGSTIA